MREARPAGESERRKRKHDRHTGFRIAYELTKTTIREITNSTPTISEGLRNP